MDIEYYKQYEPIFGVWTIVKQLGEGSFGKVFEIERKERGAHFRAALKTITVPGSENEFREYANEVGEEIAQDYYRQQVDTLANEFELMSKLAGKTNIVSYVDHRVFEHANGHGWDILIQMELLTPLKDYLHKRKSITRRDVIKLGLDMCTALAVCQKHNIVHRDIKVENIMVSEDGDFKLGDFGVARTLNSGRTSHMSRKGTEHYMAPELVRMDSDCDTRVDIYSLGIVLYKLLNSNRFPFYPSYPNRISPRDQEIAFNKRISGVPLDPPINADGRLAEIVLKACVFRKEERYSSPKQMFNDLNEINYSSEEAKIIYKEGDWIIIPSSRNDEVRPRDPNDETERDDTTIVVPPPPPHPKKDKYIVFIVAIVSIALFSSFFLSRKIFQSIAKDQNSPNNTNTAVQIESMNDNSSTELGVIVQTITPELPQITQSPIFEELIPGTVNKGLLAAGADYTIALKNDGTVVKIGNSSTINTSGWIGVSQISGYDNHAIGLCTNGRLVYTGVNEDGDCDVGSWNNIKQVVTGYNFTAALTIDGRVLFTGFHKHNQDNCTRWSGIERLFEGEDHIVGLRSDGTLLASGYNGYKQCEISDLSQIVDGVAASQTTFALDFNGNVYARGKDWLGEDNVNSWTNIVAVDAGDEHTIGLKADGTVVAVGSNEWGQCDVSSWSNIVSICAGQFHTIGLKADGTLVATGKNDVGQCDVSGVRLW